MSYTLQQIKLFAVIASLLLSLFMFATDDIINRDGILYINMAQAYINGGLAATLQLFDWPFFAILIAYVHKISFLSVENSAFLLNALLFSLFIYTFISISNKILPNTRQLVIAAILILCFSTINEYRDFIIRDIGYWAFCSLIIYRFMVFLEKPTFKNASLWQIVAIIALLFRVEGGVILLALPFYCFVAYSLKRALKHYLQLNALLFLSFAVAALFILPSLNNGSIPSGALSANTSMLHYESYIATLNHNIAIMESQILNRFSEDYSSFILISGLLSMLAYKLIKGVSITYLGMFVFAWWRSQTSYKSELLRVLLFFAAINIVILITFVLVRYFISTRYCMMALISLLLLMLPRICALIEQFWLEKQKVALTIIGLVLFVGLIDSVTSSRSKSYIKNTALWAGENLPDNSHIFTDDQFIEYYVKRQNTSVAISRDKDIGMYQQYDYLIVVEKRKQHALKEQLATMALKPVFNLSSKRGDKAAVYKVVSENSN